MFVAPVKFETLCDALIWSYDPAIDSKMPKNPTFPRFLHFRAYMSHLDMIISHFTQYTGVCCIAKILDIVWCSDLTVRPRNWLRCAQKPYIPKISSFSCVFETFRYGYMHFTPKYMWLLLFWNSRHCVILGSDRATPQWTQMCPKTPYSQDYCILEHF